MHGMMETAGWLRPDAASGQRTRLAGRKEGEWRARLLLTGARGPERDGTETDTEADERGPKAKKRGGRGEDVDGWLQQGDMGDGNAEWCRIGGAAGWCRRWWRRCRCKVVVYGDGWCRYVGGGVCR